jgi:ABC-type phosphate transport system substrate-binding protein
MAASAAMAQSVVLGGGSSLVGPSIQAEITQFGANPDSLTYFITSSGTGQAAFLGNIPSTFAPGLTGTVDFANSDSALSAAQIAAYTNSPGLGVTDGPLIQIPYIVTAITVPYVNGPTASTDTFKGPQTTPSQPTSLALNDDDLCGIFSGNLTNWNQVLNPDTGSDFTVNKAITVVYRSDSSGTSELLTRHLAAVCTTANTKPGVTFVDSTTFASSFPSGVPANFIGESGSGGVHTELVSLSTAGTAAVAYLSPDWTNTFLAPSSSSATPNLAVASLVNRNLVNSPLGAADVAPTAANATAALGTSAPPGTAANPADPSDPTQWVPNIGNPSVGYPVSGTSQIMVSQCYASSAVTASVVNFLDDHYTNPTFVSIIHGNGFDTVPASFESAIQADFLSNTSQNFLDIGDADLCGPAFAGR